MRAAARVRAAAGAAHAALRDHPRHVVLFALAAGLALGPVSPAAALVAALAGAALAGRSGVALLAAGAALGGATLADARLAALDSGPLAAMTGERWEGTAVVLEPVRRRGARASARVRLRELDDVAVGAAAGRPVARRRGRRGGRGVRGAARQVRRVPAAPRRACRARGRPFRGDQNAAGRGRRRARRGAAAGGGRARPRAARRGGGAAAGHGARPGRGAHRSGGDRLPALRARPPARRVGPERDAAGAPRARCRHGDRRRAAGAARRRRSR